MPAVTVVKYDQFRIDCYLIRSNSDFRSNPVIANFANMELATAFAKWYVKEHGTQLCLNDLKTDEIKYIGEFKAQPTMMLPKEPKVVVMQKKETAPAVAEVEETSTPEPTNSMSKRDMAIAILKVIKESKPMPARNVATKAGLQYTKDVKDVLKELKRLEKIVFDNGRWRKPNAQGK